MKKVIFWDFDGTLAKAPYLWSGSLLDAIHTILPECNITLSEIRKYTKIGFTWDSPEKDYSHMTGSLWWDYMITYFDGIYEKLGINKDIIRTASLLAVQNVKDVKRYQLFDDTVSTLQACRERGYQNYILSNHLPELDDIIHQLGISEFIDDYVISSLVGYDKPRQELYDYAKRLAGYPELCYMIGDNPIADILGGNAANMITILVHREVESEAAYTCNELSEIIEIIE